jgi:putative RecB family exonuclease
VIKQIIVLIGQIAAGKTTVGHALETRIKGKFIEIESIPHQIRAKGPKDIVNFILKNYTNNNFIFECSGVSENFEQLLLEFRKNTDNLFVIKLQCRIATALERLRTRHEWTALSSGSSWSKEIERTEFRLRRVPADYSLDTSDISSISIVSRIENFLTPPVDIALLHRDLEIHRVSFSRLSTFERCPKAYNYKYTQTEPERILSAKTLLGNLVHQEISKLYKNKNLHIETTLSIIIDEYKDNIAFLKNECVDSEFISWIEKEGCNILGFHYRNVFQYDDLLTLHVEREIEFDLHFGKKITGQVDRLAVSKSGIPIVIDYKTGSDRQSYVSDVPDLLQLEIYGAAVLLDMKAKAVEVRRHAVRSAKEEAFGITVSDLPRIRASVTRWIRSLEQHRYPTAKPGKICEWCGYNPICAERAFEPSLGLELPLPYPLASV